MQDKHVHVAERKYLLSGGNDAGTYRHRIEICVCNALRIVGVTSCQAPIHALPECPRIDVSGTVVAK